LRAISNFPPHFRFFITGQAWPQARLLNGAACTDPRARVFNTALSAFPDSPVCLQCGPAGRTPAPPHAALPGLATPRSPALASIFCVPTSLRVPLHTRLRPAGQLAAQPATRSHGVLPASHQRTGPGYLATTLAGRRSYADKVSLSFMISAVVCSVPPAASASTYRLLRDSNNRRDAGHSTDVVLFFTRFQRKIASVLHTAKPSDFYRANLRGTRRSPSRQ